MTTTLPSTRRSQPPGRVAIANYSGYIVGDDAIFEALIGMVQRAYDRPVMLDALTALPERTAKRYPVEVVDHIYYFLRSAASRARVISMIARADLLLIGGGDIIEGQQAILLLVALAAVAGTPVAFVGVGVIEPQQPRYRQFLRRSANLTAYIATRDSESQHLLTEMGVHRPTMQTLPDLAVAIEPAAETATTLLAAENITLRRPYVAVNVRAPEQEQYGTSWGDAEYEAIVRVCQNIIDDDGMDIVCVPFVCAAAYPSHDEATSCDDILMLELARRINRDGRVHVSRADRHPSEVAALLRDAHLAIGMRLHFLILAASAGTPVVALSYARKVRAFMSSIGLDHLCVNIEGLDTATLTARVAQAQADHAHIAEQLTAWCRQARAELTTIEARINELSHRAKPLRTVRQAGAKGIATLLASALGAYSVVRRRVA